MKITIEGTEAQVDQFIRDYLQVPQEPNDNSDLDPGFYRTMEERRRAYKGPEYHKCVSCEGSHQGPGDHCGTCRDEIKDRAEEENKLLLMNLVVHRDGNCGGEVFLKDGTSLATFTGGIIRINQTTTSLPELCELLKAYRMYQRRRVKDDQAEA